jgi:hypothetical protein
MKTMILAAAAALTLSMGVASADSGEGPAANIQVAQAHPALRQTGNVELAYVTTTQTVSEMEWNQNQGALG